MPVTALDPITALLIVDLQKGISGLLPGDIFDLVVANSRSLADIFRAKSLPVILITADATAPGRTETIRHRAGLAPGFADIIDALNPQPTDIRITKKTWGAFTRTPLEAELKALGVTQVVITGVATAFGVESTARQAYEAGFNVTLATDAMADPRLETHAHSIAHVFPRLGETGATRDILALLD